MALVFHIRRNRDGEVRRHEDHLANEGEDWEWQWSDGNYGCDCNRHIFFEGKGFIADDPERECGEGAYSIVRVETPEGRLVSEADPRQPSPWVVSQFEI